jgi:hypothetical protein
MASTNLRLLLDESITDPLAEKILALCPGAYYVRKSTLKGSFDPVIATFANTDKRIVVAIDKDFKNLRLDEGLIKLDRNRSNEECLFLIFKMFWQSGHRAKAKHHRAYLTNDGLRVTNGEEFEHEWHPKPCAHRSNKS